MQSASPAPLDIATRRTDLIRLSPHLDFELSARTTGALQRRRKVSDAATLLRLALAYGPGALSLRSAAAWAGLTDIAHLSDVALRRRIRGAADWLRRTAGALLVQRSATGDELRRRGCGLLTERAFPARGMTAPPGGSMPCLIRQQLV